MRFGFGSNNGGVSNLIANGLTIDGITGQAVHYTPTGTASVINHQYVGCWFYADDYIFLLDNGGAGTLRGIQINGSYLTGAAIRSVYAAGAMSEQAAVLDPPQLAAVFARVEVPPARDLGDVAPEEALAVLVVRLELGEAAQRAASSGRRAGSL